MEECFYKSAVSVGEYRRLRTPAHAKWQGAIVIESAVYGSTVLFQELDKLISSGKCGGKGHE